MKSSYGTLLVRGVLPLDLVYWLCAMENSSSTELLGLCQNIALGSQGSGSMHGPQLYVVGAVF